MQILKTTEQKRQIGRKVVWMDGVEEIKQSEWR